MRRRLNFKQFKNFLAVIALSNELSAAGAGGKYILQGEILFTNSLLKISFKYSHVCPSPSFSHAYISVCYPSTFCRTTDNTPSPHIFPAVCILRLCKGFNLGFNHGFFLVQIAGNYSM